MKKRVLAILLMACMTFALAGCKKEETAELSSDVESESTEEEIPVVDKTVEEEGIEAFVALGQYKGLELEKVVYTVEETDIDNQIQAELSTIPVMDSDPERVVEEGDVVNLDYSGSVDGVAFDGGTAAGYDLEIGSGTFIDGFEDQLIGMHIGESGDIQVTFPEDYHSEDLAGVEATFAVTINGIAEYLTEPTEEWLLANTSSTTVEEYREEVRASLEASNEASSENSLYQAAWAELEKTAEFIQYPKDMLDLCYEEQKKNYENYALMYGMEYEAFLEGMGFTDEDVYEDAKIYLESALMARYVMDMEGITSEDEDYKALETKILAANGFTTREEVVETGVSEWNVDYVINYNFVMEYIVKNAVITEVPAEE